MYIIWDDPHAPRLFLKVSKRQKVHDIKVMISDRTSIPIEKQTLTYSQIGLLDDKSIDFYHIRQSATLKCFYKGKERPGIRMTTETEEELDISVSQIRFSTEDGSDVLSSSFVSERLFDTTSQTPETPSRRTESMFSLSFAQGRLESVPERKKVKIVQKAPDYRVVFPGYTPFALCRTEACPAFKDTVYVSKGFGVFKVSSLKLHCPKCHKPADPTGQCGFYKSQWRFTGVTDEGVRREEDGQTAAKQFWVYESPVGKEWVGLKVVVGSIL